MTYIKDISSLLLAKLNRNDKIVFNGLVHKGNPNQWKADISKLKNLGFKSKINIETGISNLADWLISQQG
jgi:nucleoside-diphosphate-sugar epimerase